MSDQEHPAITRFRDYLRVNTMQPNPDYQKCMDFLSAQATDLGLLYQIVESAPGKPNIFITVKGTEPSLPSILLNSHTDVVPVFREKWSVDPFEAVKRDDGYILARGAQDMKCVGWSYFEAIRVLLSEGWKPKRTVHMSFVADEEIGGQLGMKLLVNKQEFKDLNVGFALDEGIASPKDTIRVFYGERAPWWVKVVSTGQTGHGSQLIIEDNATLKLMKVVNKFLEYRADQEHKLIHGIDGRKVELGDVNTINLTMLNAGVQFNVVPQEAWAGFDVRVSPRTDIQQFKQMLIDMAESEPGVKLEFVTFFGSNKLTAIDDGNKWWEAVTNVAKQHNITLEPEIFPAATDSRYLREIGIPAFGISYLKNVPILLHDHDERIHQDEFLEGIPFYTDLIKQLAEL
ncbi:adenylate cyclase [Umbelopsis sp. WA50703]